MEGVAEYELSADGKKLLVRKEKDKDNDLYVFDASDEAPEKLDESKVDLSHWTFSFDPREQWRQMFVEAWRLERDYFYDPGMHGLAWPKIREKYEPLVERVTSRGELNDLLAQMVSELSALHIFVGGGDVRKSPERIEAASLGAELARDAAAGGWRVSRIYRADPDFPARLSPLRRNGVNIEEGDVIESVNGISTLSVPAPGALLRTQAGRQVLLHVKPQRGGSARDAIVVPISAPDADSLRYDDWEYSRRQRVEEAGKGAIGYVHLGWRDLAQCEQRARGQGHRHRGGVRGLRPRRELADRGPRGRSRRGGGQPAACHLRREGRLARRGNPLSPGEDPHRAGAGAAAARLSTKGRAALRAKPPGPSR
jgi:tricorn protease